jgi:hypothetical protein
MLPQGNCTGGCVFNPTNQWDCMAELCGPSPCFVPDDVDAAEVHAMGKTALGTCVPGKGYALAPDKTQAIPGAYAAFVNQSMTMMNFGGYFPIMTGQVCPCVFVCTRPPHSVADVSS